MLTLVYMFNFIDRQILAILLPTIRDEFQVSDLWLGILTGPAFALFYITLGIPVARLADRHNRRNIVAWALALWSTMTVISGFAANFVQLTLARIGVGIGEAGGVSPSHSIIADLYPPEYRGAAMGFYTLGISIGIMLAFIAGGWVAANIGWREALFLVGAPGILLAVLIRFTVVEPPRGHAEGRSAGGDLPQLRQVAFHLWRRRSFLHMAVGAGASSLVGYSVIGFLPSFLVRSFTADIASLGLWLGLIVGVVGGAGFFFGGYIADRIGKSNCPRAMQMIALLVLLSIVPYVGMYLSSSWDAALLWYIVPAAIANVYLAPVLALIQGLVPLRMRTLASALALLVANAIGLLGGPWLTGMLSTLLEPRFGAESMRYSLLIVTLAGLAWAACHYFLASRHIDADLDGVAAHD